MKIAATFTEAIAFIAVGAAAGYYVPPLINSPKEVHLEAEITKSTDKAAYKPGAYFACHIATDASAYEDRFDRGNGERARAYARTTAEQAFGLRVSDDGKSIEIVTGTTPFDAAQAMGRSIPITLSGNITVATGDTGAGDINTVVLEKDSLRAAFSYTGLWMTGLKSRSVLLNCQPG